MYSAPTPPPAPAPAVASINAQGLRWIPRTLHEHLRWLDTFVATRDAAYDRNKDGKLEFDEYLDAAFASLSIYVEPGGTLYKSAFLQAMLGPKTDPITQKVLTSHRAEVYIRLFNELDRGHKRYLIKPDIVQWQRTIFRRNDRNHDGAIEPHEADVGR